VERVLDRLALAAHLGAEQLVVHAQIMQLGIRLHGPALAVQTLAVGRRCDGKQCQRQVLEGDPDAQLHGQAQEQGKIEDELQGARPVLQNGREHADEGAGHRILDTGVTLVVRAADARKLGGVLLEHPWSLVAANAERISRDVAALWPGEGDADGAIRIGEDLVSLGEGAEIEPGVYADTRGGPVRLEAGVRVEGPARLVGPLYVGRDTKVLGGSVGTSSIGPVCIVRGEVADSVLLGFVNKAHDGYVGHAMLGRWVNLGAFTTNSDLKNNYRPVRVWTPDGDVDTGLLKVGCFLGDHVKTGIGTVLNTGSVVGAGSNVFGGVMPPSVVPPFSWGSGSDLGIHRCDQFLATAERVMGRRRQELTPGVRRILEEAWDATAGRRGE